MDLGGLLGVIVTEALGMRGKRHGSAASWILRGAVRRPGLAAGVLGAAGVAYGMWERSQRDQGGGGASAPATPQPGRSSSSGPPPLPPSLPTSADAAPDSQRQLRQLRLVLAAAQADGHVSTSEMQRVLDAARKAGAESGLLLDLATTHAIESIVASVTDITERRELYALAFGMIRADEGVNESERAWLARLASALALSAEETASLETAVSTGIDTQV